MTAREVLDFKILEVEDYRLTVFNLVVVLGIILFTYLGLKIVKRSFYKVKDKSHLDTGRKHSIFLIIKYIVWVVAILSCIQALGIKLTLLLAGSAALLVGLGLGIQQIFNDIVSGMFLLFEGSISVGDILEVDGMVCQVREINLRSSKVRTRDDIMVIVPNHKFINENVVNWSHQNQLTRFSIEIGVSYKSDPEKVRDALLEVMHSHDEIIQAGNRKPSVRFVGFGDSALNFKMLFYSKEAFRIEHTMSEIRFEVFKRFREEGIEIPFPQRDIHFKSSDIGTSGFLQPKSDDVK